MSIHFRFRFAFCLVAASAWNVPALAIDDSAKGAARELSSQGKEDFDAGRFEGAAQKFQRAFDVAKVPTLALWSARSRSKLGQLVAASELYRQALQLTPNEVWVGNTQQEAQAEAQAELDALTPRIPKLRITVVGGQPSEVALSVDGVSVPSALVGADRPSDPGKRRVVGKRGGETADVVVELKERETKEVILKFSGAPIAPSVPSPAPGPAAASPSPILAPSPAAATISDRSTGSTQRTLGWIGLGVGAAGIIEGAVTGIFVVQRYSKLKDGCPGGVCNPTLVDGYRLDMYNALRTASMVGFVVGGVGLAAGATLLLTSPSPQTNVGLFVGPSSAGIHGAF
jgi:hypothetical protein